MNKIKAHLASGINFTPAVVCYLIKGDKVILGFRKRVSLGLGENLISGIGGKVGDKEELANETLEEALRREVLEEIGVSITSFRKMGRLRFIHPHKPKWNQDVIAYVIDSWDGEPQETDDINPMEFEIANLPTDRMWDDNQYWVPQILAGQQVEAIFLFDETNKVIEHVFS